MWRALVFILVTVNCFASSGEILVEDDLGQQFRLQQPAQRIISLAPNITESLFFIGAGAQVVGADEFSNYPEAAKDIPRVSNYAGANYERLLSLQPDLVIAWNSGNGEQLIKRIRNLGLPVFIIEPRSLHDLAAVVRKLGILTGHADQAEQRATDFERGINELANKYSGLTPVRVFYQIWNEPLITLNGKHLISDVLRLCGGENVFADAAPLVPYVNMEGVIQADPQVIIASGSSDDSPAWLGMWRQWPQISAVANNHVYYVPPDLMQRHSLRILEGAGQVCADLEQAR